MDTTPFAVGANLPALAALVADRVRDLIVHGGLAPGERVKEAELAAAMQVSRGPVREAIALLAAEGLIETQRYRGARVIEMSARDIDEVYSLRLAIERLAMARAAERMTAEIRGAMDDVLARMKNLPPESAVADVVALDLEFHDLVYEAADHRRLDRTWAPIRSQVSVFLNARTDKDYFRRTSWEKHRALRDVLVAGAPEAAVSAVERHIGWALHRLSPSHVNETGAEPEPRTPERTT